LVNFAVPLVALRGGTVVLALLISPLDSGYHVLLDSSSSQTLKPICHPHLPLLSSATKKSERMTP
jgi:hypothetical protein